MALPSRTGPLTRPRSAAFPRRAAAIGAVVVCGLARTWYLDSSKAQFNADEAATGVMVRHIRHGHNYVFFAGQNYGGTLEAYLQAAMYLVLRLPQNPLTLRLVLVALSMATCALIYLVARRVIATSSPAPAVVAALLYAVSPWFNVIGSVTSLGFYAAGQLTAISAIYCALRLADADSPREHAGWAFLVGFASGLAVWTTVASIYVLVPVVFWIGASLRTSWSRAAWVVGGALLGGLPLWVWFVQHRQLPIPPKAVESSSIPQRLGNLFGPVLRQYVGVTYAHTDGGLPLALQIVVVVVLLAALVAVMAQRRRGLLSVLRLRPDDRRPMDLLLAVPIVVVIAYAASDSTWYTGTPRYLLITYPLFSIGLAALLARLRATPAAVSGAVIVVLMAALSGGFFRGLSASPTVAERDRVMGEVTRFLVAQNETYVYGDYWTAIPLQYVAGGRLEVAVCVGSKRFADTQRAVAAHNSPVYVSSPLDGSDDPIGHALTTHNVAYRKTTIGTVTIYDHIPGNVQPSAIGL